MTSTSSFPLADRWFDSRKIDDDITMFIEPHVIELMRCNIWHVRGSKKDLIVDSGMGVASLVDAASDLLDKPVLAVATHGHDDHIGSHHEFDEVLAHPKDAHWLANPDMTSLNVMQAWGPEAIAGLEKAGYTINSSHFVTALPAGMTLESYAMKPAKVTRLIEEGDVVDLGDRQFEVLHLPGHSPGSIGLWEPATGIFFSGDAIYDGPLLDELSDSDIGDYCQTMERLLELPVRVVHGGHDPSFGRDRLREIATHYLKYRRPSSHQ
jgi:glyoxylase-like metal-dependent hydrolase (beta-lactamase superfamily II)